MSKDMIRVGALVVFLVYFWYWTTTPHRRSLTKPVSSRQSPPSSAFRYVENASLLHFERDGLVLWSVPMPDSSYVFAQGRFFERDACFGREDGTRLLARGKPLYEFLQQNNLSSTRNLNIFAATDTLRGDDVFYFTCFNQKVDRVDMCPTGHVFRDGECVAVNACLGRPKGTLLSSPTRLFEYYECPGSDAPAVLRTCKTGTWFLHDACRPIGDYDAFCETERDDWIRLLDPTTRISCRDGKASLQMCPRGERFFDSDRCESTVCVHEPEGTRVPLPFTKEGPFSFSPGYRVCKNGRVSATVLCDSSWSPFRAEDKLMHLPMVFDGNACEIPKLCTNVHPDDPDIVVPSHNFSKYASNWIHADAVDGVTGTSCDGRIRKRKSMDPGFVISKRFKPEMGVGKTFLAHRFDAYHENGVEVSCPERYVFDGASCRPEIENAFSHFGLGLFRWSDDAWFKPWKYVDHADKAVCADPDDVLLETWNACAHSDCQRYPFLSRVEFTIYTNEGYACEGVKGRIVKTPHDTLYDYWKQRPVRDDTEREECRPGDRIRTGNFAFDSTVYATCDADQPFVFCPHTETKGIDRVSGRWHCVPKSIGWEVIEAGTTTWFEKNQVQRVVPRDPSVVPLVDINVTYGIPVPISGVSFPKETKVRFRTNADVIVHYRYQLTLPPEVVYENKRATLSSGAFLMKASAFTSKPVTIPSFHSFADSVSDFKA